MQEPTINSNANGLPFIWLHGMLSSIKSDSLNPLLDFESIKQFAKVIRYNYRDKCENSDYTWKSLSEELSQIIVRHKIKSPVLGGLSMGVGTILHYVTSNQNDVKALVLYTPPPVYQDREPVKKVYRKVALKTNSETIPDIVKKLIEKTTDIPDYVEEKYPDARKKIIESRLDFNPVYFTRIYNDGANSDFPDKNLISRIKIPTLIIAQTNDDNHPVKSAIELQKLIKGSELLYISNLEDYIKTSQIVNNFIIYHCLNNNL